jgi:putative MATE family efflux protein
VPPGILSPIIDRIESVTDRTRMDLTSGSIPVGILSLAVPMILSMFLHSIQSLVDMFFVGKLGPASIAAVGMSGAVIWILVTAFMGVNIATVAMVSRAVGAGDEERASHVAGQALALTAVISAAVGVVGYLSAAHLLRFLGANTEVVELGTGYLHITFVGTFFLTGIFIISGVFQGMGDTVTPLLLGIVTTVCNVILDPILIFGWLGIPPMGVRGSALATVIARTVSLAAGLAIVMHGRLKIRPVDTVPDPRTMWTIVAIGVPGALQMGIRAIMNLALMTIVAKFGTITVAAYTVGMRIRMIGLFPSFGFGGAAATMVGQNLGAGRPERSKRSAFTAAGMALAAVAAAATVFAVFAPYLVRIFNDDPGVVAVGARFLRVTAAVLVTASVSIVLGRSMSGAGDTVSPMVITLVMLWGFQIPAAVYLSGIRELWGFAVPFRDLFEGIAAGSEDGVWYAMLAASVLQAAVTVLWFLRGKWMYKKV